MKKLTEIKDNLKKKATDFWWSYGDEIILGAICGVSALGYGFTMYKIGTITGAGKMLEACEAVMPDANIASRLIQASSKLKK